MNLDYLGWVDEFFLGMIRMVGMNSFGVWMIGMIWINWMNG